MVNRIKGYSYNGKKTYKLYEQKLELALLESIDEILSDFYSALEKAKQE